MDSLSELPVEYRAGGIVCQRTETEVKFLLVTSNSNKERWIIPAGHIEEGEKPEEAAVREVLEEAGVVADIVANLGNICYTWFRERQKVCIDTVLFLMRFREVVEVNPEGRQVQFFTFKQIEELNLWDETRDFLKKAAEASYLAENLD